MMISLGLNMTLKVKELNYKEILPQMSLTTNRTGDVASMFIINMVSAGAGGVETMDHVAGIDVRESLRGQDLNIDSVRASQMILEITFSTLSNMNVGNLLSLTFYKAEDLIRRKS